MATVSTQYFIQAKIKTKPITRLLKIIPVPFLYVQGHNFKISISIKNWGPVKFSGGKIVILVSYAFGNLFEKMDGMVPSIDANNEVIVDLNGKDKWGILAHGHALLLALLFDSQGNLIQLCNEKRQLLQIQSGGYHVHSFYSLTRGEIYVLVALYVNVLMVILANYDKLAEFFKKIFEFLIHVIN